MEKRTKKGKKKIEKKKPKTNSIFITFHS